MSQDHDLRPLDALPDRDWTAMDLDAAVAAAAQDTRAAISRVIGRLAYRVTGQPHPSDLSLEQLRAERDDPAEVRAQSCDRHLVAMRIERQLGLDHTGNALNARRAGASWTRIGEACGTSRQAAQQRWGQPAAAIDMDPDSEPTEDNQR